MSAVKKKQNYFGFLDKNNKVLSQKEQKIKLLAYKKQNKNKDFLISDSKAFSDKQIKKSPLFVYGKQKQNRKTIGKKLITQKIKKRRYRHIRQLKKLEIRYNLDRYRLSNIIKNFRKLKLQKSSVSKLIKKLKLRISKLLKHKQVKHSRHQSEKFNVYIIMLKKLKRFRRKLLNKISYIKRLYARYINQVNQGLKKVGKKTEAEKKKEEILKVKYKENYNPNRKPKPKAKSFFGVLKILTIKRNIFITLSDIKGNVRATVSSGLLKVKGKKRQAPHIIRATAQKIISLIFKHRILKLFVFFRGRAFRKKKKTVTHIFSKVKKFEFLKINRPARRCHNGCRSPKKRRK